MVSASAAWSSAASFQTWKKSFLLLRVCVYSNGFSEGFSIADCSLDVASGVLQTITCRVYNGEEGFPTSNPHHTDANTYRSTAEQRDTIQPCIEEARTREAVGSHLRSAAVTPAPIRRVHRAGGGF